MALSSRQNASAPPASVIPADNPNISWLRFRGVWVTNVLLVAIIRGSFAMLPGMTSSLAWTITNICYNLVPIIMD